MTEGTTATTVDGAADPSRRLVRVWMALVVLLGISVVGPVFEIPVVTAITAFGIAIVKTYLVVRYFMHVTVEPRYVLYILATMVAFVLLFYAGVAPDVQRHEGQQWVNLAARRETTRGVAVDDGESVEPGAAPEAFDPAREFATVCGACHGVNGAGDGPAAASLDPSPANFTDPAFWETRDRAHVLRVVSEGGPAVGRSASMPSFGSRYDAAQLEALVDHVVGLAPAGAVTRSAAEP